MSSFDWQSINQNFQGNKKLEDDRVLIPKVNLDKIHPDPDQPRENSKESEVESLAQTIEEVGVIHPILCVREGKESFKIVSGERRYWALKEAGREQTDIIVIEDPKKVLVIQLIENISRKNLNPVEEARAFQKLVEDFDYKQKDLAEKFGKSRSYITRSIKVLNLSEEVEREMLVRASDLSKEVFWIMAEIDSELQMKVWKKIEKNPTIAAIKKAREKVEGNGKKKKKKAPRSFTFKPKESKWIQRISLARSPRTKKEIKEAIDELDSLRESLRDRLDKARKKG